MMDRRTFVARIAGGLLGLPLGAIAQEPGRVWRIGFLYFASRDSALSTGRYQAFMDGMRELGYVEGKNLVIEALFADANPERLPALTAELMRTKVDAVVATGSPVYRALREFKSNVPVVVTVTADPMIEGLAASLARPGGNFTGMVDTAAVLGPKHLDLLRSALPRLTRVGALTNPANGAHGDQLAGIVQAARKVGAKVVSTRASTYADIESAFASLAREHADACLMFGDTFFTQELKQIADAALRHRMPSIYLPRDYVQAGGLMSYGPDFVDNFRRAATFVDKILKGAKPGELSFQQPTKYVFAINLRTARALGLTVPQAVLLRADEVVE